jgi:hypothetical protein
MSRKDEDRILHGLYYYRESIDEEFAVTDEQILWLAAHSYFDGGNWSKEGEPQSFDTSLLPFEIRDKLLTSKFDLPLRYLQHRRLIKYAKAGDGSLRLAVTFAGADRAIRLHTRLGRMDVWYQERKDGFLGIVTTIVVALITALVTVLVTERMYKIFAEQTRIIYEVEPRAQP